MRYVFPQFLRWAHHPLVPFVRQVSIHTLKEMCFTQPCGQSSVYLPIMPQSLQGLMITALCSVGRRRVAPLTGMSKIKSVS